MQPDALILLRPLIGDSAKYQSTRGPGHRLFFSPCGPRACYYSMQGGEEAEEPILQPRCVY